MHSEEFDALYREWRPRIVRWSGQRVPGLTREEVHQEITVTLWKAAESFNGTGSFDKYLLVCWLRRKSDLIEAFFAVKRQIEDLHEDLTELSDAYGFDLTVECPVRESLHMQVWHLLAHGFQKIEVQKLLGISRKRFDAIVQSFAVPEVRLALA